MERLTEWIEDGEHKQAIPKTSIRSNGHNRCCNKLAEYEDLEEQGLLARLPCKVGDMLWYNVFGYLESYEIKAFSYGHCDSYVEVSAEIEDEIIFYCENYTGSITGSFPMSEIGKTVFLTREEAEKKLEEMKNGKK